MVTFDRTIFKDVMDPIFSVTRAFKIYTNKCVACCSTNNKFFSDNKYKAEFAKTGVCENCQRHYEVMEKCN